MIRTDAYAAILLAGLPVPPPPVLTPRELARCVELLGKGWTLSEAIDAIQAARPTLPFVADLERAIEDAERGR